MKVDYSKKEIYSSDLRSVNNVLKSGWLTHGKFTDEFEKEFCKFTGSKYCVTVSSCTAGLHLSCIVAGFKKGDEVIVPSMTHVATAHAVEHTGAKAVIADIDYRTGNLDLINIKKNISTRTRGIIIVHMAGLPCDLRDIVKFCKEKKITLIEDCAHGLGSTFKKIHVGNFGITGNFSFYPTKQITTGEGGAIITNNKKIYKQLKQLKAFGIDKDIKNRKIPGDYDVKSLGLNYRLTDFQAALGLNQVKNYNKNLKRRREIAKRYSENLKQIKQVDFIKFNPCHSFYVFQILLKERKKLIEKFKSLGIGFSIQYLKPINQMSYYKKKYNLLDKNFKSSNLFSKQIISLPVYPKLKNKEIDFICYSIKKMFNES